jgi:hypothetical protein
MFHCYALGLIRIHEPTFPAIRESDGPMIDRLVGRNYSKGCSGVYRTRQEVFAIEGGVEQKADDDKPDNIACSDELTLHSVGDVCHDVWVESMCATHWRRQLIPAYAAREGISPLNLQCTMEPHRTFHAGIPVALFLCYH